MKPDQILHSSHLDLLFENRNHAYGAYDLRKHYDARLKKALIFVFLFAALVSIIFTTLRPEELPTYKIADHIFGPPPQINEVTPPPPKPPQQRREALKGTMSAPASTLTVQQTGSIIKLTSDPIDPVIPGDGSTGLQGPSIQTGSLPTVGIDSTQRITNTEPVETAEQMPAFPGGPEALNEFLRKNLRMPDGLQPGEEVTVKVRFIVGFDGTLRGFSVIQDGGSQFNSEVVRVLKQMPDWIPGQSRGRDVAVYYVIPVQFVAPL